MRSQNEDDSGERLRVQERENLEYLFRFSCFLATGKSILLRGVKFLMTKVKFDNILS